MDEKRLSELYRSVVMDHHRHPRGQGAPEFFASRAYGKNPVCGDEVTVYLATSGPGWAIRWEGEGCALCRASASILAETVGQQAAPAAFAEQVLRRLSDAPAPRADIPALPETVTALAGALAAAPARRTCARLPWTVFAEAWKSLPPPESAKK